MARSKRIYIVRDRQLNLIAAFTVKHEMHTAAKRHGWYEQGLSVTAIADGDRSGREMHMLTPGL